MPAPFIWQFVLYSLASLILIPGFMGIRVDMILSYELHKALHILGVILFLGHNTVSLMWGVAAARTENPQIVRFSLRVFTWGDVYFTAFGLLLILVNGVMLSSIYGGLFEQSWILGALIILGVSGLPLIVILPQQIRCYRLAMDGSDEELMAQTKHRPMLNMAMSVTVLLLYYAAFLMMTTKTGLW